MTLIYITIGSKHAFNRYYYGLWASFYKRLLFNLNKLIAYFIKLGVLTIVSGFIVGCASTTITNGISLSNAGVAASTQAEQNVGFQFKPGQFAKTTGYELYALGSFLEEEVRPFQ